MRQKRKSPGALKVVLLVLAAILVFVGLGFVSWTRLVRYPAFPEAAAIAKGAKAPQGWYVFQPPQSESGLNAGSQNEGATLKSTSFIFYPGRHSLIKIEGY